jgi:serine/threonine-protein kinase
MPRGLAQSIDRDLAGATPSPGLQIGRYHLVEEIGRGGMAQVFHARAQGIGGFERDVALKVLLPEYASDTDFVGMLLDEARIAGAILHPCVVGVLDVGRAGNLFYLVMEYVDGADLRTLIRQLPPERGGRIALPAALYLVSEVLRGLHAVHSAVVIHRDVSPANVLIDASGVVKLGDFGIAHASSRITRTRPGAVKGKLRYMAPEQMAVGQSPGQGVDHRADLFAIGVVLVEILLGPEAIEPKRMTPFGPTFTWSRKRAPSLPPDILDILDRALAERPDDRYRDAAQFRRDLAAALHRRAPGYGAEDLARDLGLAGPVPGAEPTVVRPAPQPPSSLHDRLDVSDEVAPASSAAPTSFLDEQRPTEKFQPPPEPPVQEYASVLVSEGDASAGELRREWPWKRIALAAGVASAILLALAIVVSLATRSSTPSVPSPVVEQAPQVRRPAAARPQTGRLQVGAPPGTAVIIGSTSYPPAPCEIELPPGQYQVKLVLHGRRTTHTVLRQVVIEAGRDVAVRP